MTSGCPGALSFNLFCTAPASSHLLSPIDRSIPPGLLSPWSFYRRGGCNVEGPLQSNHAVVRAPNLSCGIHWDRSHGQYVWCLSRPRPCVPASFEARASAFGEQRLGGVRQPTVADPGEIGQGVWLDLARPDEVADGPAPDAQRVGDQPAMAPPGDRLGAEDRRPGSLGVGAPLVQRRGERRRGPGVCAGVERHPPSCVGDRGACASRRPPRSPQCREPIPTRPDAASRASRLKWGWRREPGNRLTSATRPIADAASRPRNSPGRGSNA